MRSRFTFCVSCFVAALLHGKSRRSRSPEHPEVVVKLRAAYDQWWREILPALENEHAVGPKVNPFKELYWKQFGGPDGP